jgi:MFS family permease
MLERLGPLQERNFRRLWIGQTTSAVGDSLSLVAITFAVLAVRGSAADLGFVLAANMIPRVVFLLVGGVWADRLPRRSLMVAADAVRAAAQVGLAVAVLGGGADLWVFVLASAASGAASAFFMPAATGLIPQAVSEERLQQGNALLNLSQSTAFMVGPIVSGLLVAAVGAGWVFAIDGATFAVSAGSLLLLQLRPVESPVRRPFIAELADGWREVVARRWLVISLAAFTFGNLAYAALFVLGPVLMDRQFNGAADWGLLMGCFGLGGLLGGAIALRWRPSRPLLATFGVLLAAPVALILLALTPPLAALAIGMVVLAAATSIANTLWHTTIQQQVPADSISRVSSYDWMVSLLIFPVGSALAGPFADAASVGSALVLFAALAGVPVALVLLAPSVRAVRRRDAPPEAAREEVAAGAAAA